MSTMPSLFLKWRLFRELFDMPKSDREIAIAYWGPNEGPSRFSKMLRGDYGVSADAATMIADVINRRIATWRGGRGLPEQATDAISASDLELAIVPFVQRLLEVGGEVGEDALDRAHRLSMSELVPQTEDQGPFPRLLVERYSKSRAFLPFQGAGADGPTQFDPAEHLGQLAIELDPAIASAPAQIYMMVTRDGLPAGQRMWDGPFSDTVWWLPSPFEAPATTEDKRILLMPEPQPVMPLPGRYSASAVLVFDPAVLPRLDPRGNARQFTPQVPNETATLRFLTNLSRVKSRSPDAVAVTSARYEIIASPAAQAS